MPTLAEQVLGADRRPQVVRDCADLVDSEVRRKTGLSGMAVKSAYRVVRSLKPNFVPNLVDFLLDDFVAQMEPFYADYLQQGGGGTFGAFIRGRAEPVADALLQVTDARAERSTHKTLRKLYARLRPQAMQHVVEAIPALADLMDRHLAAAGAAP